MVEAVVTVMVVVSGVDARFDSTKPHSAPMEPMNIQQVRSSRMQADGFMIHQRTQKLTSGFGGGGVDGVDVGLGAVDRQPVPLRVSANPDKQLKLSGVQTAF